MLLNMPTRRMRRVLVAGLTAISVALPASLASAGALPEPEDPTVEEVAAIVDAAAPQVKLTDPILLDDGELVGMSSQGLVSLPSTSDGSATVESLAETGGLKGTHNAIKRAATSWNSVDKVTKARLALVVEFGWSMLSDALGIGSCASLVKAIVKS